MPLDGAGGERASGKWNGFATHASVFGPSKEEEAFSGQPKKVKFPQQCFVPIGARLVPLGRQKFGACLSNAKTFNGLSLILGKSREEERVTVTVLHLSRFLPTEM